jgi:zinc metalloprotease ZmpA
MTHGVTSRTAGLTYSGESGGLNEATSDIFGTMVEYYAGNAKDAGDYKIGEKLYVSNPGESKALRYMYKPSLDGASADCWSAGVGSLNVHYSSGVGNHFYYLLAEGSNAAQPSPTCNGSTVTGVGRDAAATIYYRALTVYMTSSTSYAGARAASLNAARDLYGSGSSQYAATAAAWAGVNVN